MHNRARRWLAVVTALAASGAGVLLVLVTGAPAVGGTPAQLPDLDQFVPSTISVIPPSATDQRYLLAFDSRVANGATASTGPMVIRGRRTSLTEPMVADQVLRSANGAETVRSSIGSLTYAISSDHSHWHYDSLNRYQLRRASDLRSVRPDNKTGFCLPDKDVTPDYCARSNPNALGVLEGIGRGYVDLYKANLEGQNIDVTNIPAGTYYLVHWANRDSSLCERSILNNVSATKLKLWPAGYGNAPYFKIAGKYETLPPPERQPRPADCPLERKKPKLTVTFPRRQNVARSKGVVAYTRCNEACWVAATAKARGLKFVGSQKLGARGRRVKSVIKTTASTQSAIVRKLRRGRAVTVKLTLSTRDNAGNNGRTLRRSVTLLP